MKKCKRCVELEETLAHVRELHFSAVKGEPFNAYGVVEGDAITLWAAAMVGSFKHMGAKNYLVIDLVDPATNDRYSVTMQKAGAVTPTDRIKELEQMYRGQVGK